MSLGDPKKIDLPSTKSEWIKMAKKVIIPLLGENEKSEITQEKMDIAHGGEHPAYLTLREVGNWKSASKVDLGHFLLARILFRLVPLENLKTNGLLGITKKVQEISRDYQENVDVDFTKFIDHIKATGDIAPPPGKAKNLGVYSLVRHHQLMISRKVDASFEDSDSHGPAGGRRSLDMLSVSELSGHGDLEDDLEIPDTPSIDDITEEEDEKASLILGEMISNFSEQPSEYSDETLRSMGEDIVNSSLVDLLTTVTMGCPHVKLDWGHLRKKIDLSLGNAQIRTINDGCLASRSGDDLFAVLEAKPFRLMDNPVPTVMQMGLEMMAHIYECETKGQKKSRYRPPNAIRQTSTC